jgi:alpha-1,2-mannosyltransferase
MAAVQRSSGWLPRPHPAMAIGGVVVCAAAVSWLFVAHLGATPAQRLVDLDVYREAGRSVLDGRDLYSFLGHPPQRLPFTYPPFAAMLAVPLAVVPFLTAGWIWTVGEVATTAAIVAIAFRPLLERCARWWPLALGALTGAMQQMLPLRDEVKFGQVDELLVLLCLLDCMFLLRRRGGGVLIGVATAVKLTPGVFIVYLLVSGRRRAAAAAAGVFVACSLLAAAVLPHDSRSFWTDALWHSERLRANDGTSNQSIRGMWLRAVPSDRLSTALWIASVVVVAVVGFRRAATSAMRGDELTGVALTGLLAVLLSPVAWIHHLVWLPLVLAAIARAGRGPGRVLAAATVYVFFVVKVPWIGAHWAHHWSGAAEVFARFVEDGYGLGALAILFALGAWSPGESGKDPAKPVTVRHNRFRRVIRGEAA